MTQTLYLLLFYAYEQLRDLDPQPVALMGEAFYIFQAEDGIRDLVRSRGLGDVYKRQICPRVQTLTGSLFLHSLETSVPRHPKNSTSPTPLNSFIIAWGSVSDCHTCRVPLQQKGWKTLVYNVSVFFIFLLNPTNFEWITSEAWHKF